MTAVAIHRSKHDPLGCRVQSISGSKNHQNMCGKCEVLGSPCSFSVCGCPERFVVDG